MSTTPHLPMDDESRERRRQANEIERLGRRVAELEAQVARSRPFFRSCPAGHVLLASLIDRAESQLGIPAWVALEVVTSSPAGVVPVYVRGSLTDEAADSLLAYPWPNARRALAQFKAECNPDPDSPGMYLHPYVEAGRRPFTMKATAAAG